jgi:hypothetical protein
MGDMSASERVLVETFPDKYHSLLLLVFMPFKAYKTQFFEPVLHALVAIINSW